MSSQPLTKSDGVGFSVSEARANAGEVSDLWYNTISVFCGA